MSWKKDIKNKKIVRNNEINNIAANNEIKFD